MQSFVALLLAEGEKMNSFEKLQIIGFVLIAFAAISGIAIMWFMSRPQKDERKWWRREDYKAMQNALWVYVIWAAFWVIVSAIILLLPLAA